MSIHRCWVRDSYDPERYLGGIRNAWGNSQIKDDRERREIRHKNMCRYYLP